MSEFQNLDLSGVQVNTGIQAGEHEVTCTKAEVKTTKSGNGKYIAATFAVAGSPLHIYHNFNISNPSEEAQKIGLGQLKSFLKASMYQNPEMLKDVTDLLNLKCVAKVKIEESAYGEQPRISFFKPIKGSTPTKGSDIPF